MKLPLLDRWARRSQQAARRNAMVASTEAVQRRIERDEVAAYVAARAARHDHGQAPATEEVVALAR